ncbi:MAG: methionyl-tRNA formyltransferase [Woeseiaceae bacterium]
MSAATILFAGTPDFAQVSLQALVEGGYAPAVVLTQPDRRAGRGKRLTASPVKSYAQSVDIEVWQPETLRNKNVAADILALQPALMVVAAYGLILPQAVLDIPDRGCVNVHASLLPRWRGAAPIQQAILNGDEETGICLMQMEAGLDTGPVYAQGAIPIGADETAGELHDRLARLGGELLVSHMDELLLGNMEAVPQDDANATYAAKISKADAAIDWSADAPEILRQIRAYNPVPGACFESNGELIKCWRGELLQDLKGPCGQVINTGKAGIDVACGRGGIRLTEVQRPGRKRISGREFAAQNRLDGVRFV